MKTLPSVVIVGSAEAFLYWLVFSAARSAFVGLSKLISPRPRLPSDGAFKKGDPSPRQQRVYGSC